MSSLSRMLLSAILTAACAAACADPAATSPSDEASAASADAAAATPADPAASVTAADDAAAAPTDAPLAASAARLLELAYSAASKFPLEPHAKNRARDQALVVDVALELDQPERALSCIAGIENWRRGLGHARLAFWCAERGHEAQALEQLELARAVASWPEERIEQSWRRDRIRARMAATLLLLDRDAEAEALVVGLDASEVGALQTTRARLAADEAFETTLDGLERALLAQPFDVVRAALDSCAVLYGRSYDDPERRARIEQRIMDNRAKMPRLVAIDVGLRLAETALEHDDPANALRLVDDARGVIDGGVWNAEDHIPLLARQAALRHAAGERQQALDEADAARGLFESERARITDIYRADALVPLAEAYVAMGQLDAALEVYALALDESVQNPNSRPRVDDYTLICLSLARHGVEPHEALWSRLAEIQAGLGDPW